MAELKSQGPMVPVTKLGPIGANFPRLLDAVRQQINPLEGIAAEARKDLSEQRQLEAADAAAKHEFSLDERGLPILPEDKPSFSIFGKAYNQQIRRNYLLKIKNDVNDKLNEIADRNYLSPSGLAEEGKQYLEATANAVNPLASLLVSEAGGARLSALLSGARGRFSRLQIANAKRDVASFVGRTAEELSQAQYPLGSEHLSEKVATAVNVFFDANPSLKAGGEQNKKDIIEQVHREYADNIYFQNAQSLPLPELSAAISAFAQGEPYTYQGKEIFPKYTGMKEGERPVHINKLNMVLRSRNAWDSVGKNNAAGQAQGVLGEYLLDSLRKEAGGKYPGLVGAAEQMLPLTNPEQFVSYVKSLRTLIESEESSKEAVATAKVILPALKRTAELLDLGPVNINVPDAESLALASRLSRMITTTTQRQQIAAQVELPSQIQEFAANQINSVASLADTLGVGPVYDDFDSGPLVSGVDLREEYEKRIAQIPADLRKTAGGARMQLRIASSLANEAKARIEDIKDNEKDIALIHKYALAVNDMMKWEGRNDLIAGDIKKWTDQGLDPSRILTLTNQQFSLWRTEDKAQDQIEQDRRAIIRNIALTGAGQSAIPLAQNDKNGEVADGILQTTPFFIEMIKNDATPQEIYSDNRVIELAEKMGVLPKSLIEHISAQASDRSTIANAVSLYKTYTELKGGISQNVKSQLNSWTTSAANYLISHGINEANIEHVFSPGFARNPSDTTVDTSSVVFGLDSDGKPFKPAEIQQKKDDLLNAVIKEQKTNRDQGIFDNIVEAFRLNSIGRFALPADGDDVELYQRTTESMNNILLTQIQTAGIPKALKDSVMRRFDNNAVFHVGHRGPNDDRDAGLKGAMADALLGAINEEGWGIGKFDLSRPRSAGLGYTFSRNPIERYARVAPTEADPTGLRYFHKAILNHVKNKRLYLEGDTEDIGLDDIRLVPTTKTGSDGSSPLYQVLFSRSGGAPNMVVIESLSSSPELGDVDRSLQKAGYLYFDISEHKRYREDQIEIERQFKETQRKIIYRETEDRLRKRGRHSLKLWEMPKARNK